MHGGIFAADIHNKDQIRQTLHGADAVQPGVQSGDLALDEQAFLFGQAVDLTAVAQISQDVPFPRYGHAWCSSW